MYSVKDTQIGRESANDTLALSQRIEKQIKQESQKNNKPGQRHDVV